MSWQLECTRKNCKQQSRAANIVALISDHTDAKRVVPLPRRPPGLHREVL